HSRNATPASARSARRAACPAAPRPARGPPAPPPFRSAPSQHAATRLGRPWPDPLGPPGSTRALRSLAFAWSDSLRDDSAPRRYGVCGHYGAIPPAAQERSPFRPHARPPRSAPPPRNRPGLRILERRPTPPDRCHPRWPEGPVARLRARRETGLGQGARCATPVRAFLGPATPHPAPTAGHGPRRTPTVARLSAPAVSSRYSVRIRQHASRGERP